MKDEQIKLVIGALLHDIGKVIYRQGDKRRHSLSGYEYLKESAHITDNDILESVKFHHGKELMNASIADNSFAYITYIADNIASAADRRKKDDSEIGFDINVPLESVFNILNGNNKKYHYKKDILNTESINFPTDEEEKFDEYFYKKIKENITDNLSGIYYSDEYINSLLQILEANLTYIPSSTAVDELADISLYDHLKITAAISSCIYEYLCENQIENYRQELFENSKEFYEKKVFLMYSIDISGIQKFIYTIHSEGALKMLRARSFYLEIMMESVIDNLSERLGLSRANLIYSGGGHCYILLSNTEKTKSILEEFEKELNLWLLHNFDISLYVAGGYSECSAQDLKNNPSGSYKEIYRNLNNMISRKKAKRYGKQELLYLNSASGGIHDRECKICKRTGNLNDENECFICASIASMSKNILYTDFFTITSKEEKNSVPLPFGCYLVADDEISLKKRMEKDDYYIRSYSKNKLFSGRHLTTKLWVGNYTTGETFEELAKKSEGVRRIGIIRADIDNLGKAFVSGFENDASKDRYVTISRTATLSRHLSLFFKCYINNILSNPEYTVDNTKKTVRNATIVYSGGDDLFIVGSWNDIVEIAVDINNQFEKYTEGTLTLSAGIGIYHAGFPIKVSADEVADLEEESKRYPKKNAVTFLPDGCTHEVKEENKTKFISDGTYEWSEFVNGVIGQKYKVLKEVFTTSEDRGKSFLYRMLELIRLQDEEINFARFIYLISRLEPGAQAKDLQKQKYKEFSHNMYEWIKSKKDCRELKTAITMYAYTIREDKNDNYEE